jgi:hypothetical protein
LGPDLLFAQAKVLGVDFLKSYIWREYPKVFDSKFKAQLAELAVPVVNQDPGFLHNLKPRSGQAS